jgi:hypothetical protein
LGRILQRLRLGYEWRIRRLDGLVRWLRHEWRIGLLGWLDGWLRLVRRLDGWLRLVRWLVRWLRHEWRIGRIHEWLRRVRHEWGFRFVEWFDGRGLGQERLRILGQRLQRHVRRFGHGLGRLGRLAG